MNPQAEVNMPIPSHSPVEKLNQGRKSTKEEWKDKPTPQELFKRSEPKQPPAAIH